MPRSVAAGLLAAVGVAVSVLVTLVHGGLVAIDAAAASIATGLSAYLALPSKNSLGNESSNIA
jgi:hypothetical protein